MRVVVVVVVVGRDYFEVMALKLTLSQGQLFLAEVTFIFSLSSCSPTLNFLRGGICDVLKFLFNPSPKKAYTQYLIIKRWCKLFFQKYSFPSVIFVFF